MSTIGRADVDAAQAAPPLSPQDTVPSLREDLVVARGAAPGQFEVRVVARVHRSTGRRRPSRELTRIHA